MAHGSPFSRLAGLCSNAHPGRWSLRDLSCRILLPGGYVVLLGCLLIAGRFDAEGALIGAPARMTLDVRRDGIIYRMPSLFYFLFIFFLINPNSIFLANGPRD